MDNSSKRETGLNVLSLFDGMSCTRMALEELGITPNKYFASEVDKYSIQMSKHLYPDTVHLGDVQFVTKQTFGSHKIDLIVAGSPCFVSGTMVICQDEVKPIESVKVGDLVLTHENRFKAVLAIGSNTDQAIWDVKAQGISDISCTSEHPFYIRKMSRKWDNSKRSYYRHFDSPKWIEASELSDGDFIGVPILKTSDNPLNITHEEAFIIGRYIADGHVRKDLKSSGGRVWQMILSIGSSKLDSFKDSIVENHFSCYPHSKSVHRCVFSSMRLVSIVEANCGVGADNKHISMALLNLPKSLLERVLDGYMAGDGCATSHGFKATTVSKRLCDTLTLAVAKCYGVGSNTYFTKRPDKCVIDGRVVNQKDTYTFNFSKQQKKQSNFKVIDDIVWFPIKSVIKTDRVEQVFNIEVDEDNSYTANNAIVHNCQGFSNAGKGLNFDDPRSALFFEFVRLVRDLRPKYFLLENVKMKKEWRDVISHYVGCEPIFIQSSLVSAQSRPRYYWTNIPGVGQPDDEGILLRDILDYSVSDELSEKEMAYMERGNAKWNGAGDRRFDLYGQKEDEKGDCITANIHKGVPYRVIGIEQHGQSLRVPEATKLGYAEAKEGEGLDLSFPKSKTRRGRLMKDKSNCVTSAGQDMGVVVAAGGIIGRRLDENGTRADADMSIKPKQRIEVNLDPNKTNCLTSVGKDNVVISGRDEFGNQCYVDREKSHSIIGSIGRTTEREYFKKNQGKMLLSEDAETTKLTWRKLTVRECARLQTVPEHMIDKMLQSGVSNSQMYKQLGNGFTIKVISHILKNIL